MIIKSNIKKSMQKHRAMYIAVTTVIVVLAALMLTFTAKSIWISNVRTPDGSNVSVFIPTGSDFQSVKDSINSKCEIVRPGYFEFLAKRLDYVDHIKAGHYVLKDGMTNLQLINMLRLGQQTPVKVVFNNIRNIEQLAGKISSLIEADSISILNEIRSDSTLKAKGFNEYNYASLFIPNTYEFYWNTDAKRFLIRMKREYKTFWNETRIQKAKEQNLTLLQVSTLASIIDKETTKTSEMKTIAGVYMNRLKKRWPLQADPTLIFALGDYEIHRVLDIHKVIESPYNTYKYAGLPPGPICIPSIAAIDAVLNAENHKYFYFCAKDDLSGYHVFARNIDEHNANAEKYRRALNRKKIYR